MCGLIGIFGKITDDEIKTVEKMSNSIRHRGPDWSNTWSDEKVCFGFRRLSIIDLEGGNQPFEAEFDNCTYVAVYNGEVYNYLELKAELEKDGIVFKTNSEIEVMLAMYHKSGADFVKRLRGMFAFLIYDKQKGTLLAARDSFGIKPMYYIKHDNNIVFSSEMKAYLFDDGYDEFKVDRRQLQHYLTFQYVTEPDTICGDIKILSKGSYMLCTGDGETITEYNRYIFKPDKSISYDEKKKRLRKAIESSVEYHLLSDVPVGSFLSSGIDSAIITAVASRLSPGLKAFTVGFDVEGYSELENATQISKHLNIEHVKLQCTLDDFVANYENVIYHLDSPVADPSTVAIYLICRTAGSQVKTVLSGEGSDELFAGYRQYSDSIPTSKIFRLPRPIKDILGFLAKILLDNVKGKGLITRGITPVEKRFVGNSFVFVEKDKPKILNGYDSSINFTERTAEIYSQSTEYSQLLKMQHCDLHTWLASDILVKGDRLSMAHSLEVRVPYLDREVFEAASVLCDNEKLSHDTTKYILRDAFSDLINHETLVRPKLGYPVPVRKWLGDELYEWAKDIIKNSTADEYINTVEALKLLELHRSGKRDLYHQIWVILVFITWYKLYVTDSEETRKLRG
ncbi:MAG: asparagine synthase (glutamine-hydrolyzing) [Clostridiales bacterium GWF2_38_85]|nr:MAG: asparagine synthase (glutamine-hydrolyzing) [Clostridiales bacterium GWF2_38_85]HBL85505.1 asparagine synthase (glutamine-hydrolyzing) [Clostridiales bacterium]